MKFSKQAGIEELMKKGSSSFLKHMLVGIFMHEKNPSFFTRKTSFTICHLLGTSTVHFFQL